MIDSPETSVLDFSSPRRPPTQALRQLGAWQANVCAHLQDDWKSLLAHPVRLIPDRYDSLQHQQALMQLPEEGIGVYFSVGESLLPAMMVFSTRQIHAFVADLLDLPGETWPEPTPLTAAEDSMLELLFARIADAIGEGWPGPQPLKCQFLETTTKPQRTRLFPINSALFSMRIKVASRFGEEICHWIVLKEETERLMLEQIGEIEPEGRPTNPALEQITERVPMQVTVQLGEVELRMSEASALSVGDVLILDQFVSRPLLACVEGQPKWAGVPVRIGSRQGFQITHVIDSDSASTLQLFAPGT